ncbi:MAG: hypothetical protein OXC30_00640 [Alphaproteobacteria bacterium]|nr:hypothetical protein [Alphaproteobacteria bacterium]
MTLLLFLLCLHAQGAESNIVTNERAKDSTRKRFFQDEYNQDRIVLPKEMKQGETKLVIKLRKETVPYAEPQAAFAYYHPAFAQQLFFICAPHGVLAWDCAQADFDVHRSQFDGWCIGMPWEKYDINQSYRETQSLQSKLKECGGITTRISKSEWKYRFGTIKSLHCYLTMENFYWAFVISDKYPELYAQKTETPTSKKEMSMAIYSKLLSSFYYFHQRDLWHCRKYWLEWQNAQFGSLGKSIDYNGHFVGAKKQQR